MAAADHGEGIGGGKIGGAAEFANRLLSGINQVGINFRFEWIGPNAQHAIFRLQDHFHALRDVVSNERRHAYSEIDVVSVPQFASDTAGDAFALLFVG